MSTYRYKAYDRSGRVDEGTVSAASRSEAAHRIRDRDLTAFELSEAAPQVEGKHPPFTFSRRALSLEQYARLTRELAVLLQADLPLDSALRLITARERGLVHSLVEKLLGTVTTGSTLSNAFEAHAPGAPSLLVGLIRAGETRGDLTDALDELSSFLELQVGTRARVRSAMTYPLVLIFAALFSITVILMFLVPALLPLFTDAGVEPPALLKYAVIAVDFVSHHWLWLAVAALGTALLCSRALMARSIRLRVDRIKLHAPLLGTIVRNLNTSLTARVLGVLLKGDVSLVTALQACEKALPNMTFSEAIKRATEDVKSGDPLSSALQSTGEFTDLTIRFVAIGEEAGNLHGMLIHLADMLDRETRSKMDHMMTLLGPAVTILLGLLVGGIIVSVMQAMLGVNELVLR